MSQDPAFGPSSLNLEELARFFGYSHDLLAILDGRGRVLLLSPSVEQILGYSVAELTGRALLTLVHPEDVREVRNDVRRLFTQRAVADVDCRFLHKDGHWLPMRWSVSAKEPQGRIYGVGRDRTGELRRRDEARTREEAQLRLRTAAELHDGILQTLTAAGLQLEVARRMVRIDPAGSEEVLRRLAESVAAEQRELRLYVDELKLDEPLWADGRVALGERLGDMLDRIYAIWGVGTSLECSLVRPLNPEFERRVLRLVQESVVNAARHGGAGQVGVRVEDRGDVVVIDLTDDGAGFPFLGDYDDQALREQRIGPVSLKQRVAQGGGTLFIRSTKEGAVLQIMLPVNGDDF